MSVRQGTQGKSSSSSNSNGSGPASLAPGHLKSTTALNLAYLYDVARKEFTKLVVDLKSRRRDGKAAIIVDRFSFDLLSRIVPNFKDLVGSAVFLEQGTVLIENEQPNIVIFCIHPSPDALIQVAKIIKDTKDLDAQYHVIHTPRKTMISSQLLKEEGVAEYIRSSEEWRVNVIPVDHDVITMEMPLAFRQFVVHNDKTPLFDVARAIMQLQMIFGMIPRVVGKGQAAHDIWAMVKRMGQSLSEPLLVAPEIDSLVIFDRREDAITPLCSQMTYEGLVDEVYNVKLASMHLPAHLCPEDKDRDKGGRKVVLDSSIKIFNDIRNLPWPQVGPLIARRSKILREETQMGRKEFKTTTEMRKFTKHLKTHLLVEQEHLPIHTNVALDLKKILNSDDFMEKYHTEHALLGGASSDRFSRVKMMMGQGDAITQADDYIEDCISKQEGLIRVLRLLCLRSLVTGGLKASALEYFRREVLQTYGFTHSLTLDNLELAGLLKEQTAKSTYSAMCKAMNLIGDVPEDIKLTEDYHFAYMGYAPLSIRIVEQLLSDDHSLLEEFLPGKILREKQRLPQGLQPKGSDDAHQRDPVTVVCFVGGVTQAEIAALRHLSRHKRREYVVMTTDIVTGTRFLRNLREPVVKNENLQPSRQRHNHH